MVSDGQTILSRVLSLYNHSSHYIIPITSHLDFKGQVKYDVMVKNDYTEKEHWMEVKEGWVVVEANHPWPVRKERTCGGRGEGGEGGKELEFWVGYPTLWWKFHTRLTNCQLFTVVAESPQLVPPLPWVFKRHIILHGRKEGKKEGLGCLHCDPHHGIKFRSISYRQTASIGF